jgi:FAD/FMN-containing dehydrogenase
MVPTLTQYADLTTQMTGEVVTPAHPDWDATRQAFNLTADLRPYAIALPRSASDVVAAIDYARYHGLRVAPQATGHNAAPLGTLHDALLVDVRNLQELSVDPEARRVRVGAGVKWESVEPLLAEHGLAALHGSSPDVGVAGYSLGGGMGWLARSHGLQANSVTAIELVTADGVERRVDAENEPDLFWALRGGNGNFGVVTAIEFAVYPLAELYAGALFYPFERASEVLHAWAEMTPAMPDEMMLWAKLMQFPDMPDIPEPFRGNAFTIAFAAFTGDEAEGRELLRPLRELGPEIDTVAVVPPAALGDLAMDPADPLPFVSTTSLMSELPAAAVDAILAAVGPDSGSPLTMVEFRQMGGALGRRAPGAGARATLPGEFVMLGLSAVMDEEMAATARSYLDALDRAVAPYRSGDYPNFVEEQTDTSAFFDAETWARLRQVKALYDPSDMFKGNHHIPPA